MGKKSLHGWYFFMYSLIRCLISGYLCLFSRPGFRNSQWEGQWKPCFCIPEQLITMSKSHCHPRNAKNMMGENQKWEEGISADLVNSGIRSDIKMISGIGCSRFMHNYNQRADWWSSWDATLVFCLFPQKTHNEIKILAYSRTLGECAENFTMEKTENGISPSCFPHELKMLKKCHTLTFK